jgi:putative mycofactocin binding protein MftB
MASRLADGVRVRKESWGLLFYAPSRHRVLFVRSGEWLRPGHFDGHWSPAEIAADIAGRTGVPAEHVERTLPRLTARLAANGMIADEIC